MYLCVFVFTLRDTSQNLKTNTYQKDQERKKGLMRTDARMRYIFFYHSDF